MNIPPALPFSFIALLLAATPVLAADPALDRTPGGTGQGLRQGIQGMSPGSGADMGTGMSVHNPDTLKWEAALPSLPQGAQITVLDGDPFKPGPYTLRLQLPSGYQIPPHWHSRAENLTVISGTLSIGMGDTLDMSAAQELQTGGFHALPARVHHFAFSPAGAVVQIHGEGPFDITYLNPADNPDPATRNLPEPAARN